MVSDGSVATAVLSEIKPNGHTINKITWLYNGLSAEYSGTEISGKPTVLFGIIVPELLTAEENSETDQITVTTE